MGTTPHDLVVLLADPSLTSLWISSLSGYCRHMPVSFITLPWLRCTIPSSGGGAPDNRETGASWHQSMGVDRGQAGDGSEHRVRLQPAAASDEAAFGVFGGQRGRGEAGTELRAEAAGGGEEETDACLQTCSCLCDHRRMIRL